MPGKKISGMDPLVLPVQADDLIEVVRGGENFNAPLVDFDGAHFKSVEISPDSFGGIDLTDDAIDLWIVNLNRSVTSVELPENLLVGYAKNITILFKQNSTGGYAVNGWPAMDWDRGLLPVIDTSFNGKTTIEILFISGQVPLGVS